MGRRRKRSDDYEGYHCELDGEEWFGDDGGLNGNPFEPFSISWHEWERKHDMFGRIIPDDDFWED